MEQLYCVEIQRTNISPKQFYSYCKKQIVKRTGEDLLENWVEDYSDWSDTVNEFFSESNHEDWEIPAREICKQKSFDWQLFLEKAYNFIMEFQFDTENKGTGYLFMVEFRR